MFNELNFFATASEAESARKSAGVAPFDWATRYVSIRSAFEGMLAYAINDMVRWESIPESWRSDLRLGMLLCGARRER
ncbi:MAG TPA: hypothetical protein VIK32_07910 [Candidatus Limnocylindrales bacterium]